MGVFLVLLFVIVCPLVILVFLLLFSDTKTVKDISHYLTRTFKVPSRTPHNPRRTTKTRSYEVRMNYGPMAVPPTPRDFSVPYSPTPASDIRRLVRTEPPVRAPPVSRDYGAVDDRWVHRRPQSSERAAKAKPSTALSIADTTAAFWKERSAASRTVLLAEATNPLIAPAVVPRKVKARRSTSDATAASKGSDGRPSLLPPPPRADAGSSFVLPSAPKSAETTTGTQPFQFSFALKK